MKLKRYIQALLLVLVSAAFCYGETYFPDIKGYKTLICDFHTHTVFSDGKVWPTVRIDEAHRESIDAVAITDHIEYQPFKDDIPTNHNRSYDLVRQRAEEKNILAIKGTEITRGTPPGHYNAVFIKDVDPLDTEDFLTAIELANGQGGFVFWNHHTWQGVDKGGWEEIQTTMYDNHWLRGMEVANGGAYYPLAHQWCLDKNMTMLGNSDIHDPSLDYTYTAEEHRTLTLVFADERTLASIHEALLDGRTAVWYKNQVIGREQYLEPLFDSCIKIAKPHAVDTRGNLFFEIENTALIDLKLTAIKGTRPATITIPARSKVVVRVKPEKKKEEVAEETEKVEGEVEEKEAKEPDEIKLQYQVENFLIAPETGLTVELIVSK